MPVVLRVPNKIEARSSVWCLENQSVLCSGHLVSLATLSGVDVDAADHHRECHGIDFDRERSSVLAAWHLEAASFESLRPYDKAIAIPEKDLASITRSIEENEVIAVENILPKRLSDDRIQTIKALPHVRRQ